MSSLAGRERFVRTLRCEAVDRPPVWLMRQAGRTLPEYRALKQDHDFVELMKTPELAAEVTLQPIRRFGMDGAVIFSDILVVPEAMGMRLSFGRGMGPVLEPSLLERPSLRDIDPGRDMPWLGETIQRVRDEVGERQAVLGFAGAPWTLLCYMVPRLGGDAHTGAKKLLFESPGFAASMLDRLAEQVIALLRYQVEQGVDAVQLFDTWAGELSPEDYARFVAPLNARIVDALRPHAPILLYLRNGTHLLPQAIAARPTGLAVDWRVDLPSLARQLDGAGHTDMALQGNLDPSFLLAPPDAIRDRVHALHSAMEGRRGHIFNLGHGLHPFTPLEGIQAFVDAVRGLESARELA